MSIVLSNLSDLRLPPERVGGLPSRCVVVRFRRRRGERLGWCDSFLCSDWFAGRVGDVVGGLGLVFDGSFFAGRNCFLVFRVGVGVGLLCGVGLFDVFDYCVFCGEQAFEYDGCASYSVLMCVCGVGIDFGG